MCEPIIGFDLWNRPIRLSDLERIGEEEEGASDEEEEDELALLGYDPTDPRTWWFPGRGCRLY